MKQETRTEKQNRDDRGSGLIMVLVAVALLGLLVSVLMFVSYAGYQMRLLDRQGKDAFYSAETVLDEVNVGLQEEISDALSKAYVDLMSNYGLYSTPQQRQQRLYKVYYDTLKEKLALDSAHTNIYSISKLRGYLSEEILGDGSHADGSLEHFGTYGAVIESNVTPESYALVLNDTGIILKDLKVTYVDKRGAVSIISTDIKIVLPDVSFAQSSAFPDLNRYSMVAQEALHLSNQRAGGSIRIEGDVYAGAIDAGKQDGAVAGEILFTTSEHEEDANARVVSRGDIEVVDRTSLSFDNVELWCDSLTLSGAKLSLSGITNVKDDLTITGDGSSLKVKGEYDGYGTDASTESKYSAIVVNGKNSSLDLSEAESLFLGGHAYISTAYQTGQSATALEQQNKNNVLMGESIAVKSNQLIYLIPPECLGCEIDMTGATGPSKYYRNPLTLEQYQEIFVNNRDKYVQIDVKRPVQKLGNKTLEQYLLPEDVAGFTEKQYVPEVVFKQTNGKTLVYCYLRFKDEAAANSYFRDYYGANASNVERYTRLYAKEIKVRDEDSLTSYYLAGNVLAYEESGSGSVLKATDSYGQRQKAGIESLAKTDSFTALNTKLVTNLATISTTDQGRTVYDNLIHETRFNNLFHVLDDDGDGRVVIANATGDKKALFCKGDYEINAATPADIRLIVCNGDVTVKKDFDGLILASGTVTVNDWEDTDGKVVLSALSIEDFTELMLSKTTVDGTDYYVLDVFRDGASYAASASSQYDLGTREVDLAELIRYERWSKK